MFRQVVFALAVLVAVTLADREKRSLFGDLCNLTPADVDSIKAQLRIDEGYNTTIYNDSVGKLTFGIGHLIKEGEPEYGQPIGTLISTERIESVFKDDFNFAVATTFLIFYPNCVNWPSEVKRIIVNMAFNLGVDKLLEFRKFIAAVNEGDWNTAADEMVNSLWYYQVKNRAVRLVERMRAV